MIQDIAPSVLYNEYEEQKPRLQDVCFLFDGNKVFVNKMNDQIVFPKYGMISPNITSYQYLFCIDDINYFLVKSDTVIKYGYKYVSVRDLRYSQPKHLAFALVTAYHLYTWYENNKYCGRCGKELEHDEQLRALNCKCGNQIFPRISPAVIVAVVNDDKILLTKYKDRPYSDYALVAGFSEIGETLEDTVRREVMEETGLEVSRIRYYGSQPWGVDSNLLVGFFARLQGDADIYIEEDELSEAGWFRRNEIDRRSDGVSLTSEMIEAFKNGYQG